MRVPEEESKCTGTPITQQTITHVETKEIAIGRDEADKVLQSLKIRISGGNVRRKK